MKQSSVLLSTPLILLVYGTGGPAEGYPGMINDLKDNIESAGIKFLKKQKRRTPRIVSFANMAAEFLDDMARDNVGLYAAQSAFFTVLSAVPFLMIVILCLKYFVDVNVASITMPIRNAFPEPVSTYISRIISEVFYRSESLALLSATVITALWSSSRGTMAIYSGLNCIFGYVGIRNWLFSRIASFFYNLLLLVVIVAAVVILVFGNTLMTFIDKEFVLAHYLLLGIFKLKFPIFFVLFVLGFAALYTFLPQRKAKYRSQLIGAAATALGWIGFSYIFSLYIMHYSRYSFLYGSLTAIILLMLWIYFCIYMLLIGAEINKHIESGYFRRMRQKVFRRREAKTEN